MEGILLLSSNVAKSILKKLDSEAVASSRHQVGNLRDPVTRIWQMLEAEGVDNTEDWVKTVSNALYEADDLVDEAATHVAKSNKVRSFASLYGKGSVFSREMSRKMERVWKKLGELEKTAADAGFVPGNQNLGTDVVDDMQTQDDIIVGRDDYKERIVNALLDTSNLEDDPNCFSGVTIGVAIVGQEGMGKTTLAKLVYNDKGVADHFDLRWWVYDGGIGVDARTIISNIVTNCLAYTKSTIDGLAWEGLITLLHDAIAEKVFLLVLDDVRDIIPENWLSLKSTLATGARGSRILVTTRSFTVATLCTHFFYLGESTRESWQLFSRMAFGQQGPLERLIQIAEKILDHCHGILLFIVVAARFLRSKNQDKWTDILSTLENSKNNNNREFYFYPSNILKQGYDDLPSPLKACFAYLSLFPRDFEYNILDVVSLWQAQGFLEAAAPDLGEAYCLFLARRAFLTDLKWDENGKLATFKMHFLLYELANKAAEGWEEIHVSLFHTRDPILVQENLVDSHKLRTFLSWAALENADRMIGISQVMKLSKLRVLDLHAFGIQILPDSIGNLIHLRYLDLSHNHTLVKLPDSMANLYNLQTLKLNFCYDLKELPTYTRKLACLRRLEIDGCEKLTYMPPGFENLTSLRILPRYVVGRPRFQSTSGFLSLSNLNRLQGRLVIELSENWTAATNEVAKSNLSSKTRLTELAIKWGPARGTSKSDSLKHQTTLDGLQPPPNLKMLHIEGYRGPDFPRWAKSNTFATALPELVTVSIDGSGQCKTLPPFSRLPHLKRLTLRFMDSVQFFENSDNRSSSEDPLFPSLEELTLHRFYGLERWCEEVTTVSSPSFKCLKKLKLWSCPNLESMPLFPNVEVLDLQNINKKLLEVPNVTTLPSSSSSEAMNFVPRGHPQNLPLLETLHKGCPNLKTLEKTLVSSKNWWLKD